MVLAWLVYKLARPVGQSDKIVLDSCALIDGRILELAKDGYLQGEFIIPGFVLRELQQLADGKDAYKRSRGRYGLEIAEQLQSALPHHVKVDNSVQDIGKTDDLLIVLAKKRTARLFTTDYNLGKIANLEGIKVINLNGLSLALRPLLLPGEELSLKIIQAGDNSNQGVGYTTDGSMVVVYSAHKLVGTTTQVIIERSLQTASGRMHFAHLKSADASARRVGTKRR